MERTHNRRALAATAAMVGAGVLACGAVVGRYHSQKTALEQFMLVPVNGPMLFSHPGGTRRCAFLRRMQSKRETKERVTGRVREGDAYLDGRVDRQVVAVVGG
jgi:hypothetical protein